MDPDLRPHLELALPEFGVRIPFGPTDFTQVNHRINEVLVGRAVRLLDPQPDETVVDFFCGLGNFTLPLATQVAPGGRHRGQRDAGATGARGGRTQRPGARARRSARRTSSSGPARTGSGSIGAHGPIARVLIDPPREGALELARSLAATSDRPRRIVYVSCNPATLARDCAVLVHEGAWTVRAAGVVNMFPHTSHVESIAVLEPAP